MHQRLQHARVKARVDLAPEHGGRDVEPAADLALREAVHVLRRVVREPPAVVRERVCTADWLRGLR